LVEERNRHIVDFFAKIYKKEENQVPVSVDDIRNFLGPEKLNSDLVRLSMLTEEEKNFLSEPLSILEFRRAINECKKNTAPGNDGIGNAVLKKFWPYLEKSVLDYCNFCFDRGSLSDSFSSANIRL